MYRHLKERKGNTASYLQLKRERELGVNISENEWLYIWRIQPHHRKLGDYIVGTISDFLSHLEIQINLL